MADNSSFDSGYILLDENANFSIESAHWSHSPMGWQDVSYFKEKRRSLILRSGDKLNFFHETRIEKDYVLNMCYAAGLPEISEDGLICEISCILNGSAVIPILSIPILGGKQVGVWRVVELDLSWLAGEAIHVYISCLPGPLNDPSADWLAISQFCIARKDRVPLVVARSFSALRVRNEIEHFSNVYKHEMYASEQDKLEINAKVGHSWIEREVKKVFPGDKDNHKPHRLTKAVSVEAPTPFIGESPYSYACRLLAGKIATHPPDFVARIKVRAGEGPIKILSLCSGAARIEAGFSAQLGTNVEWTLLDINSELLKTASQQFTSAVKVELIEANVNDISYFGRKWDIILCVSALHHIVELEKLFKFCHASLHDQGEFWSIGENIGRNGNRLWPDALNAANTYFQKIPEHYRLNMNTGVIDNEISDQDYSVGCFEGIRSQAIESAIDIWFQQEYVYRRNCFLWRIMDLTYSDNYDLKNLEDVMWINKAVQSEYDFFKNGGRGTELHGVYRKRFI